MNHNITKKRRQIKERKVKRQKERGSQIRKKWKEEYNYKAPEVILSQSKPSTITAGDLWSIGVIFAELLQMQRENRPDPLKRGPIFPLNITDGMDYASRVDHMQVIFDIIGRPATIKNGSARRYLRSSSQERSRKLKRMFPGASNHALDLFKQLITFDVDKRITIDQALEHPYLKDVKDFAYWKTRNAVKLDLEYSKVEENRLRGTHVLFCCVLCDHCCCC